MKSESIIYKKYNHLDVRRFYLFEFGKNRLELAFVLFAVLAALFTAFNTWQHVTIASLLPETTSMRGMMLGCAALFFSTVTWAAILRVLGIRVRLSLTLAFLVAHILFAVSTCFPIAVTQGYLALFGIVGVALSGVVIARNLSFGLGFWCLAGLLIIPVLWSAVSFIAFALPHANFFTVFNADRTAVSMVDLLHQRAYIQIIHKYGIPSVGINGLAYHNYHWLIAFPLSTLSDFSGIDIKKIHANILPGFTGPVLIHGIAVGLILMSSRLLHGLLAGVMILLLYATAILFSPAIFYGLVFLTPSTAYSMGLSAPIIGLFTWYLNGNLSQLKNWHFVVLGAYVLLVGLAKVNTMLQIAVLMGVLWCAFVLQRRNWMLGTVFASSCLFISAAGSLYFLWEIWQHGIINTSAPEAYKQAFQALSSTQQTAIWDDIQGSLIQSSMPPQASAFENQAFYKSPFGACVIAITLISLSFSFGLRAVRKHWHYLFAISILTVFSYILIIQRTVFGFVTPTQVQYIILPGLLLGIFVLSIVVARRIGRMTSRYPLDIAARSGAIFAAGFLVFSCTVLLAVHVEVTPKVRAAALRAVVSYPGMLANEQGKMLLRRLTAPRVSTLGLVEANPEIPSGLIRYWENWNRQPLYEKSQSLQQFAQQQENEKIAVFIPKTSGYWSGPETLLQNKMFWVQGATGLVLYRGKVEKVSDFSAGNLGRGISDFGAESAGLISKTESVFCWPRFKGYLIVDLDLNVVRTC